LILLLKHRYEFFSDGLLKNAVVKDLFLNEKEQEDGVPIDLFKKRLNKIIEEKFNLVSVFKDKITIKDINKFL
jgi:hypothetical protein